MEHPEISPARNESNIIRRVQGLPGVLQGVGLIAGSETHIAMRLDLAVTSDACTVQVAQHLRHLVFLLCLAACRLMRGSSLQTAITGRRQQPYDCRWMQLLTKQPCLVNPSGRINELPSI